MSDLCTLGSRPGMECVPLRSPADPYHYHHVTDQTKSLQELQNEVGALLEFRDLVIETFPDLKTKMASASAANSTLTGIPSSSLASSRREWEPGIRTRRKLTQKDHLSHSHQVSVVGGSSIAPSSGGGGGVVVTSTTGDIHHAHHHHHHQHQHQQHNSSSLISRSRSNSQSGGSSSGGGGGGSSGGHRKEPKSGDAQSSGSVVIQDSGFSTETSSSKETHSASSSTGNGLLQGTINVSNTTSANHQRLAADTEDELWNLLDVIHRKSNRLREEVDALQQLEREKCRTNVLNNNQNQNVINATSGSGSSRSSNSSNNNHHHHHIHSGSNSSSSSSGNLPHHHHVAPSTTTTTTASGLAKTFQNQLLVDVVNKDDVQILRKERDRLFEQLSDYEAEAMASRIRASKMQDEVDVLAAAKRDLEGQLQAALSQKLELNTKIHDLHQQFVNKSAPSSPDSIKSRHHLPLTPGGGLLRKHSSTDSTTTTLHLSTSPSVTSSPSSNSQQQQHLLKPSATRFSSSASAATAGSSFAPVVPKVSKVSAEADHPTTTTTTSPDAAALGKLDGLLSSPARANKVRMTDSKKIAAILLETNIVELQRHLLTITVQNQVLQQRLEYATRSRIFMSKKLDKSKEDIDDLKFRLEEKNIELEGTKAQLRVLESKQQQLQLQQQQSGKSSVASSGFSPEHHPTGGPAAATTPPTPVPVKPSVVGTSAGGIVTSHLSSPVHQPYNARDLTQRLQQSQVSTPSMKAMIPLAMDEVLQHSSSTESAQDQAERLTYPETPKRKPSKIPLPGTKGYVAPKPPTGRNFAPNASSQSKQDKSSPSPSGSLSNKSLNKSTGSLYMRSTGPSSITSANRAPRESSMNRPESAQSWTRRDASLEKSRSSSIPVSSKGSPVAKPPPSASTIVSNSPQPKAKRDSLTTRVKNLDSLSRLQTASASTGNLSKSSSKKDLSSTSFSTGQLGRPDRKQTSGGGIRRVSSASIARSSSTEHNNSGSSNGSSSVASPTDSTGVSSDNGKARRTNTFRLAKPTLMPPLEVPSSTAAAPPRVGGPHQQRRSHLPVVVVPAARKPTASTLIIMASSPDATARQHASSSSGSSSSSSGGSSPSSVTTVTTIESHSSSAHAPPASRDLIGEYLAAKSRSQGPPAILIPQVAPSRDSEDLELAYKHPILLMNDEDEQNVFCSVVSSVGNERNREVEVRYVDDNSIELLDAREDFGEGEKESLIVPKPKKMAFHSLKGSPVKNGVDEESKCRLVGKVNPNILKTWEQLSGADKNESAKRKNSRNSLITVTSSENSADSKQSCLIFYRNQYNNMAAPEEEDFHVNRIQHDTAASVSTSSTTMDDKTLVTSTETASSEGCYDFYDSIDDDSTRILEEDEDDEYAMAAGEGLADFTSLDRKKMMWSIDVEQ